MAFWIIAGLIALLSAAALALAAFRGQAPGAPLAAEADLSVYRDQMAEVDREIARGALRGEEAQRTRAEVARRLLEADRAARTSAGARGARGARGPASTNGPKGTGARALPVLLALAIVIGAGALYRHLGSPDYGDLPIAARLAEAEATKQSRDSQAAAEAKLGPQTPINVDPDHLALLEKLREALTLRPGDLQGYELLARNEAAIGNYAGAWRAQERVIALEGAEASAQDYTDLAELMILAAGGFVSPEAERALGQALSRDVDNPIARYYSGLMFAQNDRPDRTFSFWRPLAESPLPEAEAPWRAPVREQIPLIAEAAGIRYDLPPLPASASGAGAADALSGPSAEDVANAAEMSEDERAEMIRSMVNGLSERLATEGGTPAEWARLIGALAVLGERERAQAIYDEAKGTFAAAPEALATVRDAAARAGLDD